MQRIYINPPIDDANLYKLSYKQLTIIVGGCIIKEARKLLTNKTPCYDDGSMAVKRINEKRVYKTESSTISYNIGMLLSN